MRKIMVLVTKINASHVYVERYFSDTDEEGGKDEWCDIFMKRATEADIKKHIKPIPAGAGKGAEICEYMQLEAAGDLLYLVHGSTNYWLSNTGLSTDAENILIELSNIIIADMEKENQEKEANKMVELGFVCHSGDWEVEFRKLVVKLFENKGLAFFSRVSSEGDEDQYGWYKKVVTEDGTLDVRCFQKLWQHNSVRHNLKAFHQFLTLKTIHLETVRDLMEQKRIQEASQEFEEQFGNGNMKNFIENDIKKNTNCERFHAMFGERRNLVKEKLEALTPGIYAQLNKGNLVAKLLETFIQWFNEFSECVAEELVKKERNHA